MKNIFLPIVVLLVSLFSISAFSQTDTDAKGLGLPGDGLDLYAVLEVFQKSKTIEDFEKTLNDDNSKINNLDLDNDKKVDFIKVVTNKDGDNFSFVLQVPINKSETQDVAVILVSKDKSNNVSIQIVGDEELYGKDYVIEPTGNKENNTANPGYSGSKVGEKVISEDPTPTTVVVVQSAPIVQYVYSPMYVPYFPPYYYGYYPPYFHPWYPLTFGIYWSNHFYCHGGYYGGYRGNVNININNFNHYNNYNNNYRNRSITVNNYNRNGNYRNNGNVSSRPSNRSSRNVSSNRASINNNSSASNKASTSSSSKSASNKSTSSSNSGAKRSPRSIRSYGGVRR